VRFFLLLRRASKGRSLRISVQYSFTSTGPTRTPIPTPTRTSSPTSARGSLRGCRRGVPRRARHVQLATSLTRTKIFADLSADFCPTRALFLARMSVGDARVYTCTCTVHDKLSCTRLQNCTIGASLMSVSVPWGSSLIEVRTHDGDVVHAKRSVNGPLMGTDVSESHWKWYGSFSQRRE